MTQNPDYMELLRANGKKKARVTGDGRIFIGDVQLMPDHPIAENGISVVPTFHGRYNVLTVSFIVGAVQLENRTPRELTDEPILRHRDIVEAEMERHAAKLKDRVAEAGDREARLEHLDPCVCTVDTRDGSIVNYDCGRQLGQHKGDTGAEAFRREHATGEVAVTPNVDFNPHALRGMKLEDAKALIMVNGLTPRVVNIDSKAQDVARDRRTDRVNLSVVGGIVQSSGMG